MTALRDGIASGLIAGPTIVAAGRAISGTGGHADAANNVSREIEALRRADATNICNGADDCRRAVRLHISQGADVIKFTATGGVLSNVAGGLGQPLFDDEMKAIVDTAHLFGRKVAAHAHGADGIAAALRAGVDSVEHATYTNAGHQRALQALERLARADDGGAARRRGPGPRRRSQQGDAREGRGSRSGAQRQHRQGDSRRRPHCVRHRLGGVRPRQERQGVRAARQSRPDARRGHPGRDHRRGHVARSRLPIFGSIEPGKQADIVAVATSPLDDVTVLERVRFVMRQGVVHVLDGGRQAFPPR